MKTGAINIPSTTNIRLSSSGSGSSARTTSWSARMGEIRQQISDVVSGLNIPSLAPGTSRGYQSNLWNMGVTLAACGAVLSLVHGVWSSIADILEENKIESSTDQDIWQALIEAAKSRNLWKLGRNLFMLVAVLAGLLLPGGGRYLAIGTFVMGKLLFRDPQPEQVPVPISDRSFTLSSMGYQRADSDVVSSTMPAYISPAEASPYTPADYKGLTR